MKLEEYECEINGKQIGFYLDTKKHQYHILIDGEPLIVTKAKGEAIIRFLKLIF